ncbi:MAG: M23 family metallopeptidase [Acidobacteriota bacterium]
MGVEREPRWEVQWHPARGGKVWRASLGRRGLRNAILLGGLAILLVLAIVALIPLGLRGVLTGLAADSVRHENRSLHNRQEELREEAREISARLYGQLQRTRRLAWTLAAALSFWQESTPLPPPAGEPDELVIGWLERSSSRLAKAAAELEGERSNPPCTLASLPTAAPVDMRRAVPVAQFGWRTSPFTGKREAHQGVTLAAPPGQSVLAPGAAIVMYTGVPRGRAASDWSRLGNLVVLDHGGGVITVLGHLREIVVRRGQTIRRGQVLGTVGQSGWTKTPGLYYEVRWPLRGGTMPIDPALVCLALPAASETLDARLAEPRADLPGDFALLEHLLPSRR